MVALTVFLSVTFTLLGLLHFSWSLGGSWGIYAAIPTRENGERVLNPGKAESAVVGMGLTAFGTFYLIQSGFLALELPLWVNFCGSWIIPFIFVLRSMGDFQYVGFFKKVRSTTFANLDTWFYSPLCLLIGIVGLMVAIQ